jgi:Cupin-like domain
MPLSHRRLGRATTRPSLADPWFAWITENALQGVAREELVGTLVAKGVPRAIASRGIDAVLRSAYFRGAERVANRARRRELRARLERETWKLSSHANTIERRRDVPPDEFFERYYARGIPLILTDTFDTWPSLAAWSPSSFKERLASSRVTVTTGRDADAATHTHFGEPSLMLTMAELCDRVVDAGVTNDFYLISNHFDAAHPALLPLLDDIRAPHPLVDDQRHGGCVLLWFGPAGTVTPLHHDTKNVFLCQVFGHKRVLLFPRFETPLLGAMANSLFGPVDMDTPEGEAFPGLRDALRMETVLAPGESLFIPAGSFHQLRAADVSVSLGFSNFRAKNRFDWYTPGKVR